MFMCYHHDQSHCESSPGSFDECRLSAGWPPTLTSHTHTHPFNGPFSGTIRVSRYQKGKTNLDFTEARDSEWQWHQLGHMQVCTLLQTDNHASNHASNSVFTGRMPFLPPNQQRQSTEGIQPSPQTKPIDLGCESAENWQLPSSSTIAYHSDMR